MGMLDGLLGQVGSNADIKNLAQKVGLSEEQAEMAVQALGKAHTAPGDTVSVASEKTGLNADTLQQIVGHIGGEGSLGEFANLLDRDGDGSSLDDIADMAKGFFSKK